MKMIELDNINKFFGSKENKQQVLNGVSLKIDKGEMVAIMGPSGSGKSTILNVLGLLDGNYSGEYTLDEMKVSSLKNNELAEIRNKKIGFVFQNFNLIKELSAKENVKMGLTFSNIYKNRKEKISKKDMNEKANESLEKVGLKSHVNKNPNQLSGGQQQRVAIARALINNPDIILADEPTGALDSKTGDEIMKVFSDLNKVGKTVIIVTHDEKIAEMCRRVIHIKDGVVAGEKKVN